MEGITINKNPAGNLELRGCSESLNALGQLLILKAKLEKNLSASFTNGLFRPIEVKLSDEVQNVQSQIY